MGGSHRRMGGRGYPGESLIGTLLCGLYAARARDDIALFIALPTARPVGVASSPAAPRAVTVGLSNIDAYQFWECCVSPPTRTAIQTFRACWSSFIRDRDVALTPHQAAVCVV